MRRDVSGDRDEDEGAQQHELQHALAEPLVATCERPRELDGAEPRDVLGGHDESGHRLRDGLDQQALQTRQSSLDRNRRHDPAGDHSCLGCVGWTLEHFGREGNGTGMRTATGSRRQAFLPWSTPRSQVGVKAASGPRSKGAGAAGSVDRRRLRPGEAGVTEHADVPPEIVEPSGRCASRCRRPTRSRRGWVHDGGSASGPSLTSSRSTRGGRRRTPGLRGPTARST